MARRKIREWGPNSLQKPRAATIDDRCPVDGGEVVFDDANSRSECFLCGQPIQEQKSGPRPQPLQD